MALPVVDELTANRAMHLLLGSPKIANGNAGTFLAKTIGEETIVTGRVQCAPSGSRIPAVPAGYDRSLLLLGRTNAH